MGADLFESYVGSIIAALTIGIVQFGINGSGPAHAGSYQWAYLSAIIGFFVGPRKASLGAALERGTLVSALLSWSQPFPDPGNYRRIGTFLRHLSPAFLPVSSSAASRNTIHRTTSNP
jgi:hypothetical protein